MQNEFVKHHDYVVLLLTLTCTFLAGNVFHTLN
jgi:hypothetical protein